MNMGICRFAYLFECIDCVAKENVLCHDKPSYANVKDC